MNKSICKQCPYNIKNKKTNSQNAYMWEIISKISEKIGTDIETIYRTHIKDYGVFSTISIKKEAYNDFDYGWHTHGIGWFTTITDTYEDEFVVNVYYGTSTYNTSQIKRIIDSLRAEAERLDIDVSTYEERSLYKEPAK